MGIFDFNSNGCLEYRRKVLKVVGVGVYNIGEKYLSLLGQGAVQNGAFLMPNMGSEHFTNPDSNAVRRFQCQFFITPMQNR